MDVHYNKGLEHCIEIGDKNSSMAIKVADAKLLVERLSRTIDEAERDRDRDQMTPFEDALDDVIREAISNDYVHQYVGDRMVDIARWGKRLNNHTDAGRLEAAKKRIAELEEKIKTLEEINKCNDKIIAGHKSSYKKLKEKFKSIAYGIEGNKKVKRTIVPIDKYRGFDQDGWSNKILIGLRIRDGYIEHAALGDLRKDNWQEGYTEREFVDADGTELLKCTHVLALKREDLEIQENAIIFKPKGL